MSVGVLHGGSRHDMAASVVAQCKDRVGRPRVSGRTFRNPDPTVARALVVRCLWAAFPSPSENALCNTAAAALDCSPETVRRLLRGRSDAKFRHVWPVLQLAVASGKVCPTEIIGGAE